MDKLQLEDGSYRRIISADEVTEVVGLFRALDPFGDGEPFFEVEAEGTAAIFGAKKYGIVDEAGKVVAHTESGIGGFAPPPGFTTRGLDGRYVITAEIAGAHVQRGDGLLPPLSWEKVDPHWPALERHSLSTPDAVAELPEIFGRRPFARVIEAIATNDDAHPVALDPGGELLDPDELGFYDARTERSVPISTNPEDLNAVVVDSLRARAVEWGRPAERDCPELVILDPLLERLVGKSGGLFVDKSPQAVYRDVDAAEVLVAAAGKLGAPVFGELTGLPPRTARAIADGRRPVQATVDQAMRALEQRFGRDALVRLLDLAEEAASIQCSWPGCGEPTTRPGATWCAAHRRRSGSDRRRILSEVKR
jgi:hypothetical protein